MDKATCKEDGCDRKVLSRGWCNKHYGYAYRHGLIADVRTYGESYHRLTNVDPVAKTATCSVCGDGVAVRIRPSGRSAECKTVRRTNAHGKKRGSQSEWKRLTKYGLTREQLKELIERSGGRCAICDIDFDTKFQVDHCHETGLVRALLCQRCNIALGWFDDSPPRVLAAYMYLKAHGKSDDDWVNRAS